MSATVSEVPEGNTPSSPRYDRLSNGSLALLVQICSRHSLPRKAFEEALLQYNDLMVDLELGFRHFQDLFYVISCYEKESQDFKTDLPASVLEQVSRIRGFLDADLDGADYDGNESIEGDEDHECYLQNYDHTEDEVNLLNRDRSLEVQQVLEAANVMIESMVDASDNTLSPADNQDESYASHEVFATEDDDVIELVEDESSYAGNPSLVWEYRTIMWSFIISAIYRGITGQVDTMVVQGLLGPLLAACLAYMLEVEPWNERYNIVLFVYGAFGCLAAFLIPTYRGIAWLVPCLLGVFNPLLLFCRLRGWTTVQSIADCTRKGLKLMGRAYGPIMTATYLQLGLFVVALSVVESWTLIKMLRSEDAMDRDIGQQGLQLSMLAVLFTLVQSIREAFEEKFQSEVSGTPGCSFFWLNIVVCVVLVTIAGNGSATELLSNDYVTRSILGLGIMCAINAMVFKLGESFPVLKELF